MAKFTKLSFLSKINIIASNFFTQMFNVSILCKQNIKFVSTKVVVQVDFPAYALSMHKQNALRKGSNSNRISFFILIQMFILWISMCLRRLMKFHHCQVKIFRKKQNVVDKELQGTITRIGPLALIFYYKCSSSGYQCVCKI